MYMAMTPAISVFMFKIFQALSIHNLSRKKRGWKGQIRVSFDYILSKKSIDLNNRAKQVSPARSRNIIIINSVFDNRPK
jgi:hypothetical protein